MTLVGNLVACILSQNEYCLFRSVIRLTKRYMVNFVFDNTKFDAHFWGYNVRSVGMDALTSAGSEESNGTRWDEYTLTRRA